LQQTQADRVIGYFERVLEKYPTLMDLAHTDYESFFPYYQGMGYYSRARNLLKTAKIVQEKYNGIFPDTFEALRELPGVGPYTARAILAFGYGKPVLAWDTNLEKVFSRYFFGSREHRLTPAEKAQTEASFASFVTESA